MRKTHIWGRRTHSASKGQVFFNLLLHILGCWHVLQPATRIEWGSSEGKLKWSLSARTKGWKGIWCFYSNYGGRILLTKIKPENVPLTCDCFILCSQIGKEDSLLCFIQIFLKREANWQTGRDRHNETQKESWSLRREKDYKWATNPEAASQSPPPPTSPGPQAPFLTSYKEFAYLCLSPGSMAGCSRTSIPWHGLPCFLLLFFNPVFAGAVQKAPESWYAWRAVLRHGLPQDPKQQCCSRWEQSEGGSRVAFHPACIAASWHTGGRPQFLF